MSPVNGICDTMKVRLQWLLNYLAAPRPERGTYKNGWFSILSLIGYSVGLGNFWRFPFYCIKHEGATFLIPYLVALFIIGIPLHFMELSLGQYVGTATTQLFAFICPMLSGVGYGMVLTLIVIVIYYNVVIAWTVFYIGITASFQITPQWQTCESNCSTDHKGLLEAASNYFSHNVLGEETEDGSTAGSNEAMLILCLGISWILIAICLAGGIRNTGKVLVFTVIYPYIMLAFIFSWSYDHQGEVDLSTSNDFLKVNFSYLASNAEVWVDAASQVIYSLGIAYGGVMTLASYNKLNQNILRDSFIVCFLDTITSVFCAYVVFSISSDLKDSYLREKDNDLALIFAVYPPLVSQMGVRGLWTLLFFIMILALGFDTQLLMTETVTTALFDEFKILRKYNIPVVAIVCTILFLLGIPMMQRGGKDWFDMLDSYCSSHSFLLLGFLEVVTVSYVYGFKKMMTKIKDELHIWVPSFLYAYWYITWKFLTPLSFLVLLCFSLYKEYHDVWKTQKEFDAIFIMSIVISFSVFFIVPLSMIYTLIKKSRTDGCSSETISNSWKATSDFCTEHDRRGRDPNTDNSGLPEDRLRWNCV